MTTIERIGELQAEQMGLELQRALGLFVLQGHATPEISDTFQYVWAHAESYPITVGGNDFTLLDGSIHREPEGCGGGEYVFKGLVSLINSQGKRVKRKLAVNENGEPLNFVIGPAHLPRRESRHDEFSDSQ